MTPFERDARAATRAMRDVFAATPLQLNAHLSDRYDARIYLKREDLTPVRSYKLRGAFNAMRKRPEGTIVCASAGNHAQGVAFMCSHLKRPGIVYMPVTTPQQKVQKTQMFGGKWIEIRLTGDYFDDTLAEAIAFADQTGAIFLSPFDDPDVVEGQASVAVEILEELGVLPDHLIMPVGGGGLSAGVLSFFGADLPTTLVEPAGAACLAAAIEAGSPVKLPRVDSFADGAAVAQIGAYPFRTLSKVRATSLVQVAEDRLCTTILEMLNIEGMVLEPAGALSLDALKDVRDTVRGKTVVCVTTGGNFDFERLPEVKERAQRSEGLKKYLILRLPQRPGALKDFLEYLGPADNITRFEYLKKSARNFGSVLIGIETADASNFDRLFATLEAAGLTFQDITDDELLAQFVI